MPQPALIDKPDWTAGGDLQSAGRSFPPEAVRAGLKTGLGVVNCAVAHTGKLADCNIVREDPPGVGIGETAVAVAETMQMNPWTAEGTPVDGARVQLPLRLNQDGPKP